MNDKKRGLYRKYKVEKTEGKTDSGAKYIVLRIDKPKNDAERDALRLYTRLIRDKGYEQFASDLQEILNNL